MSIIGSLRFMATHPLTRDTPLRNVARLIRWQIGSRLAPGAIVYEWINGSKFLVTAGEAGLTGNIYAGLHEFPEMGYLLHVLRDDDLFVDVGANVGAYSILACAAAGARGVAIEPIPSTYERLIENIRINHLENRVRCLNVGIGRDIGWGSFTNDRETANHVVAESERGANVVAAAIRTLDDVVGSDIPSVIKIDVEGYETPVLEGAVEILRNPGLHSVIMEINGSGDRYGYDESHIIELMLDLGFRSCSYNPLGRSLAELPGRNMHSDNTLFVRDRALVAELLASSRRVAILDKEF